MLEQLQGLFMSMLQLVLLFLNPVILIPAIIIIIVLVKKNKELLDKAEKFAEG